MRIIEVDEKQRDEELLQRQRDKEREQERRRRIAGRKRKLMLKRKRRRRRLAFIGLLLLIAWVTGGVFHALLTFFGEGEAENLPDSEVTVFHREKNIKETAAWKAVAENPSAYPKDMLEILENHPELEEFVENYRTAEPVATGGLTKKEKSDSHPLLIQWDARWAYVPYGDDCIGLSGCAPACLSMIIVGLTGNDKATPDAIGEYSMQQGFYVEGTGTSWDLLTEAPGHYGLSVEELSLDESLMKDRLDNGGMIICSMGPGDFTTTGHFIVLYGYNEEGFLVNDPFSRERSSRAWDFGDIGYQIRNMWAYRED